MNRVPVDKNPAHDLVSLREPKARERLGCLSIGCATAGGLLVASLGVYLANQWTGTNQWPTLIVDVGVAIMLVGVLLVLQRSFIRKEFDPIIEALTWSKEQIAEFQMSDDDRSILFGPDGAAGVAMQWYAELASGKIEAAWRQSDVGWRICMLQSWIWDLEQAGMPNLGNRDALVDEFTRDESDHSMWAVFAEWLRVMFADHDPDVWGASNRRRHIAPDYEVVALFPIGKFKEGYLMRQSAVTMGKHILMHRVDGRWLVANHLAVAPPLPGWPPIWWRVDPPLLTET